MSAIPDLLGTSEAFTAFRAGLDRAAETDVTVLLVGESGTGKGLAASHIHLRGARAGAPCVVCSLAALSPTLIESSLFGHERGAFTDAHRERLGLIRQAAGGTLVLDDIELLPLELQAKLLRVLQERLVEPLGAEQAVPVDLRVIATTHANLLDEIDAKRFRADLYYRIAVLTLELPPLRARGDDLLDLVEALSRRTARRLDLPLRRFSPPALEKLRAHPWPGNVRELENAIERVLVLGAPAAGAEPKSVEPDELAFLEEARDGMAEELAVLALRHGLTLEALTQAMMERALAQQRGNLSAAARQVGLTRRAFEYRLGHNGERGASR